MRIVCSTGPRSEGQTGQPRSPMAGLPGDGMPAVLAVLNARAAQARVPLTVVEWDAGGLNPTNMTCAGRRSLRPGGPVAVLGMCQSACTILTIHIPRGRLCFAEYSSLHFHQARLDDGSPAPRATRWMFDRYPQDIRDWLIANGGIDAMPRHGHWVLGAETLWKTADARCHD